MPGKGNTEFGQFGHVYQQVGFSGEYLTDRGAIRSNGYMPVGTTAYSVGSPGITFLSKAPHVPIWASMPPLVELILR